MIASAVILGCVAAPRVLAIALQPADNDQGATCNCTNGGGTCSWHKTSDSTAYCNCGGTCCSSTGSTLTNQSITTYSGGRCTLSGATACDANTPSTATGTVTLHNGLCS